MKEIIEKICEPYKNQCDITITQDDAKYIVMLNNSNDHVCTFSGDFQCPEHFDYLQKALIIWLDNEIEKIKTTEKKKKIVVFTGAGISKESGIPTFRDSDGLWENYKIDEVATINGWNNNKELVLNFYNDRRKQLSAIQPNIAHYGIVELEKNYNVHVITQNVDDLHEKAGSTKILHLHGELTKACSEKNKELIKNIGYSDIKLGDLATDNEQLRPYIVWFGENVPNMSDANLICYDCDILLIIGTSLVVSPANEIINMVPKECQIFYIDPNPTQLTTQHNSNINIIKMTATEGITQVLSILNEQQ